MVSTFVFVSRILKLSGVVASVTFSVEDGADVLPALLVSIAVIAFAPRVSGVVAAIDHVPELSTVPVPIEVPPSSKATVSPTSPVPVKVGSATSVVLSPSTPLSLAGARARFVGAGGRASVAPPMETSPNPGIDEVGVLNATVPLLINGIVSIVPPASVIISDWLALS